MDLPRRPRKPYSSFIANLRRKAPDVWFNIVHQALMKHHGCVLDTAKSLGVSDSTIHGWIKAHPLLQKNVSKSKKVSDIERLQKSLYMSIVVKYDPVARVFVSAQPDIEIMSQSNTHERAYIACQEAIDLFLKHMNQRDLLKTFLDAKGIKF